MNDYVQYDIVPFWRKWQKDGDVVRVPYELPFDPPQRLLDDIEWVVNLFETQTCIRCVFIPETFLYPDYLSSM